MKKLIILLALLSSCASQKVKQKKVFVEDLKEKYRLYGVQNNPYFYFMMDSSGGPHLVKTHMFKPTKVIWIETLEKQ